MSFLGCDVGTYNLVVSRRTDTGEIKNKKEINAFLEIPLDNPFTYNMLKKAEDVNLIKRDNVAYVIGESAVNFAYSLNLELRRPMKDGCLNPKEKDAFKILGIILHSLIGEVPSDKETLYYTVPSNAVNQETNSEHHQKVLEDIFKKYKVNGKTVDAHPINEALALIFAELEHKQFTGIACSFGAGMQNICCAKWTQPVFQFSLVNSGDWIDKMVALATNESVAVINKEKTKVDLLKTASNSIERAVQAQYRILIEKTVSGIKKAILEAGNKIKSEEPLDIVLGGGVISPSGFVEIFKDVISNSDFPIPIGDIIKPKDHLYSVAKGCLIAAENSK